MESFEKLGAFYLGRRYDAERGEVTGDLLLYDAKDLTTHAVCVGMTGSGKTGLCVTLLEEAAIDGIPALAIDPKGDLGNLLLTFPDLAPQDFEAWIDPDEAARKGRTPAEHAKATAELWRNGLASWGEDGARIRRFREAADVAIYTPGSSAGLPLSVLGSFAAPPPALAGDADALRERILAAVSGLLALLGIQADPIRSREHILLSNILQRSWAPPPDGEGRDLDLPTLIEKIQTPPFRKVGVFDLDAFFPAKDRFELAMTLNNLLASPGFEAWTQGEPLDVAKLLYTNEGKPRLAILSIAHLSEPERMFFVTLLLNEVVAWMRSQPGTNSLRALLYMDEVFGYFPPSANPPSKTPMLTLLKQARAYGLGVVLATQNPVDLDYKGLSNAGTWFLGRLQTERDKARVIEGLEGASAASGARFDRARTERILAGLGSRVFLMNNVHEDAPTLFHTRWALSYLRGPLTREQIARLMKDRKTAAESAGAREERPRAEKVTVPTEKPDAAERPLLPPEIEVHFLPPARRTPEGAQLLYRPALLGVATLHYANARVDVDTWENVALLAPLQGSGRAMPWKQGEVASEAPVLDKEPEPGARFADLPAAAARPASYKTWAKQLATHLYKERPLTLLRCKALKLVSRAGESEGEFRVRLREAMHEKRDLAVEKLRAKYAPKLRREEDKKRRAEERLDREESQYRHQKMQTAISVGATVLGAILGRKLSSVGRATTAARGASRTARERTDVARAREAIADADRKIEEMNREFERRLEELRQELDPEALEYDEVRIRPRKSDLNVGGVSLVWTPWHLDAGGVAESAR